MQESCWSCTSECWSDRTGTTKCRNRSICAHAHAQTNRFIIRAIAHNCALWCWVAKGVALRVPPYPLLLTRSEYLVPSHHEKPNGKEM